MSNMTNGQQTAYAKEHAYGYEGGRADSGPMKAQAALNNSGAVIPFGRVITLGDTTDIAAHPNSYMPAKLIASADADASGALKDGKLLGVALHDMAHVGSDDGIKDKCMFSALYEGGVNMVTEQAVTPLDPVYVRHTANGSPGANEAVGRVRKDADGVAEVHTITPTAVNATIYALDVSVGGKNYSFEYLSDGSATAQEICDALRALMAADAAFSALITASGTTTLILTHASVGVPFQAYDTGDGALADVVTTPGAPKAALVKGFRFKGSVSAGEVVAVEILSVR
jgi:hypothetical protein